MKQPGNKKGNFMTDTRTKPNTKQPSHLAYHVRDGKSEKSYWNRIGVAWLHQDGKGFNIELATVPLDGRIVLRIASENK
jgi:hypothetical protein